ncbi:hypothetical protein SLEP1_g2353 [Rubroshorea leprosula]|uniref:EGF-like domain-containing protein n=1 Tax=Rubroshorea leprosula TaxID=152421 RepID=A0AAV5HRD3_9ROSI|nr:hypothetical protein SLEP1_g2353 [Rubroshorea leprosula]
MPCRRAKASSPAMLASWPPGDGDSESQKTQNIGKTPRFSLPQTAGRLSAVGLGLGRVRRRDFFPPIPTHLLLPPHAHRLTIITTDRIVSKNQSKMGENWIPCSFSSLILSLFMLFSCLFCCCHSLDQLGPYDTTTVSSFRYPKTQIKPDDLRYIRALESDVDLDVENVEKVPKSSLPMFCLREGSPPLPDDSNISFRGLALDALQNGSFEGITDLQNTEQCYPMSKNISIMLTSDQISSGVWYFGLFNGIGATRTQSKMIVRGPAYSFTANISVEGCVTLTMYGQYCNQILELLSCGQSGSYNDVENLPVGNQSVVSCRSNFETPCLGDGEMKVYSLEMLGIAEQLIIMAENVTSSNKTGNFSGIDLMCFVRHGAVPSASLHDYSGNLNKAPLVIGSPKVGHWYISILAVDLSKELRGIQTNNTKVCYSMELQWLQCPLGKAGLDCTSDRYMLQTVLQGDSIPFESYYLPDSQRLTSDGANFLLEPLLSNSSYGGQVDGNWTYFHLNIPSGAAGAHLHIQLTSHKKINYEVYARFGGLPSLVNWDYYYANSTSNSHGSMFFSLYDSSEENVDFYILYVKEGIWNFGLRHPFPGSSNSNGQTTLSISLERCPKRCSSHGDCRHAFDASGLTLFSFCSCDLNHGGFDCSVEIVSHQGHIWQSIALIASNAAALLPAYWALQQKAFAEWVLFTCSGISSGLYHACDVGTWCALSFGVLQFMDFWLSFMAVVSTFVYLTTIDEVYKRTIHTVVTILTALLAITKATRSSNIVLVMAIGALGLFVGWMIEFTIKFRSFSFSMGFCTQIPERQQMREWLRNLLQNLLKTVLRRFRWGFLLAGFIALAMAATSWKLEASESYWIWHSVWHVTIYTSSFFFLCSKVTDINGENERPQNGNYELTRQDSLPRGE